MNNRLQTGKYFGTVDSHLAAGPFVLNRVVHNVPREIPSHAHEPAFVTLLLEGDYGESTGRRTIQFDKFSSVYHPPSHEHQDSIGVRGAEFFLVEFKPNIFKEIGRECFCDQSLRDLSGRPVTWNLLKLFSDFTSGERDVVAVEEHY